MSLPESARRLGRELGSVRRRARLVLLGEAFLAAVAADLLYDLLSLGFFVFAGVNIYFPPFFLVIFAVLTLRLLLRTRLLPLSRDLDRKHRLKERLTSAFFYRSSVSVPAPIREAQARETLETVDFSSLRGSYAFRPKYSAAAIVLLAAALGGVMWKYPGLFKPANFVYRQGARVVSSYQHGNSDDERLAMALDASSDEGAATPSPDSDDSGPEVEEEAASPEAEEETTEAEKDPERVVKEKKETENTPDKGEEAARQPGTPGREREAPPREGKQPPKATSSDQGGIIMKSRSVETTAGPSPLVDKPYRGLAPEPLGFTFRPAEAYLPPIPLFRLLMKDAAQGALVDPESVTIVPEAYQEKYRQHIVAYFEKLLSLREEQDGP